MLNNYPRAVRTAAPLLFIGTIVALGLLAWTSNLNLNRYTSWIRPSIMTSPQQHNDFTTMQYKQLQNTTNISLDVYFPPSRTHNGQPFESTNMPRIPVVIYFHGGGLTVGNRESWFPTWLHRRVMSLGYIFISADYRLLPPSTGHDIVKDLQDLFTFITDTEFSDASQNRYKADPNRIAVSGSSAGGLCTYLAAMHCSPRPKALISLYGMGGDFFTPHYFTAKETVFFRGRELLDPKDFIEFLYPYTNGVPPSISDSPLEYYPRTYRIPGYPKNKRMLLARLYLQLGTFIDYYTGIHEPSLSETLRDALHNQSGKLSVAEYKRLLPEPQHSLFPQLTGAEVTNWPATLLMHGTADSAVPIEESRHLRDVWLRAGFGVELFEFEGQEHSFDYEPGAEKLFVDKFDEVKEFLHKHLEV